MIQNRDTEEFGNGELVKLFIENIKREASFYGGDSFPSDNPSLDAEELDNLFISPLVDLVSDLITQYNNLIDCEEE